MHRGGWWATALVLAVLWSVHLAATSGNGFALPEGLRSAVGASATTVLSRFHAHFIAPLFHESLGHLAYNSLLLAVGLPVAVRRFGRGIVPFAYFASPVAGVLVDLLVILPLAALGIAPAVAAAPERLVGASVVAFAALGMAISAWSGERPRVLLVALGLVLYEIALSALGVTQGFVWLYHLAGLAIGLALGHRWVQRDLAEAYRALSGIRA